MLGRPFKIYDTQTLLAKYRAIVDAAADSSGPTKALKNSHTGFLVESGEVSQKDLNDKIYKFKEEIYWRGVGENGNDPDQTCAEIQPDHPSQEIRMKATVNNQKWPGTNLVPIC